MTDPASPAEVTEQPQDNRFTVAESSTLHAPHQRQNCVPISDTVKEGKVLNGIHPFLLDKDNWMNILLVKPVLVDYPFSGLKPGPTTTSLSTSFIASAVWW